MQILAISKGIARILALPWRAMQQLHVLPFAGQNKLGAPGAPLGQPNPAGARGQGLRGAMVE
ncbi:hypothetical protein D8B23_18070 [Verminephrobacter aporrectodeae subsp. tuberculatae]|nr:hypothetical protein [Verminephrobacter aporrectodeae subsp. tuberculatae]MCW5257694.1 hypothetical protein [Verminephrobacter aporrectodeae subsp. tuberculatae]MCW5290674.1 hypothetical protein [Verminephrobacter aporrectodeae subsp. tuberculatae]MCW8166601.1 hypothetical protein [Verminephrobacter aporrectodeae subsp. tuberculatae]MCW8170780.1 hypothetical protein [Verminephrobacter aporrectodeae subsp. tuberculatae]